MSNETDGIIETGDIHSAEVQETEDMDLERGPRSAVVSKDFSFFAEREAEGKGNHGCCFHSQHFLF
jgi:hypothetical protein